MKPVVLSAGDCPLTCDTPCSSLRKLGSSNGAKIKLTDAGPRGLLGSTEVQADKPYCDEHKYQLIRELCPSVPRLHMTGKSHVSLLSHSNDRSGQDLRHSHFTIPDIHRRQV